MNIINWNDFLYEDDHINPEELAKKNTYLKHAISKLQDRDKIKTEKAKVEELKKFLDKLLLDLKWEDITIKKSENYSYNNMTKYLPMLPVDISSTIDKISVTNQYNSLSKIDNIYFEVEYSNFNRLHFPSGLPHFIRGSGLGYKMYKAMIKKLGYAKSEENASSDAQYIWVNLSKDPDFYCIIVKDRIFIFDKNLAVNKLESVVKRIIKTLALNNANRIEISPTLIQKLPQLRLNKYRNVEAHDRLKKIKDSQKLKVFGLSNEVEKGVLMLSDDRIVIKDNRENKVCIVNKTNFIYEEKKIEIEYDVSMLNSDGTITTQMEKIDDKKILKKYQNTKNKIYNFDINYEMIDKNNKVMRVREIWSENDKLMFLGKINDKIETKSFEEFKIPSYFDLYSLEDVEVGDIVVIEKTKTYAEVIRTAGNRTKVKVKTLFLGIEKAYSVEKLLGVEFD